MSGRAGRRGLDDKGIVILMVDEKMSPSVGKQIIKVSIWSFQVLYKSTQSSLSETLESITHLPNKFHGHFATPIE